MKVGCFALIDPFQTMEHQLKRIQEMGFKCADITDNHPGALLGDNIFAASVSLDDNPYNIKRLFDKYELEMSTVCAHAWLLDPPSPARYGTNEIMKAVQLAKLLDVKYVVTTENEANTEFAKKLTYEQQVLVVAEKLYEPVRMAADMGITVLLEPHGPLTDTVQGLTDLLSALDNSPGVAINLDTGNAWIGGTNPVDIAKAFKDKIKHIHWKDFPAEMEEIRGTKFGMGYSSIALGDGVIDLEGVYNELKDCDIEHCTLELVAEHMPASYDYLKGLGAA